MEVDTEVALRHEPAVDAGGHALGGGARFAAGERAAEVLVVDGDVAGLGQIARHVEDVEADERAGEIGRVVRIGHLLEDLHPVEFVAVDGSGEKHRRPGAIAVDHGDECLDRVAEVRLADGVAELALLARRDFRVVPERSGAVWLCHGVLSCGRSVPDRRRRGSDERPQRSAA